MRRLRAASVPKIRQVVRASAAELVARQLRQSIITGEFPPGARMRQEDLADRLAVSRGPVRQALVILEREGLVVSDLWKGSMVAPLDVPFIKDLYEFRGAVERFVAETLASRSGFDPAPLAEIVRQGSAAAAAGDVAKLTDLDERFHTGLYDAVANRVLSDVMNRHWTHTRRLMAATLKQRGYPQTAWHEHAAILDAIQNHNPAIAGAGAAAHMAAASTRVVEAFTNELARLDAEPKGSKPRSSASRPRRGTRKRAARGVRRQVE